MLERHAWSEVLRSWWLAVLCTAVVFGAGHVGGILSAGFLSSYLGVVIVITVASAAFAILTFMTAMPLFRVLRIIREEALPESFVPQIERPPREWRKRTSLRHLETLKGQLTAAEDRIAELARLEAYGRYYQELAADDPTDPELEFGVLGLENARIALVNHCARDHAVITDLTERIDSIFAGDVAAEIRMLDEHLDDLRHQQSVTAPEFAGTMRKIDMAIRACERDIAELKTWQASRVKVEAPPSPQRQKFDHVKTVEYDNERIQIWARHAKFKAYEEQLAMKKEEMEKIQNRRARGELTKREAAYLLQKLDEYFADDDRIFN